MHREILAIYQRASDRTKDVYDLGRNTDGVEEENWIIRWLLWHAFRYRDQRNNRKARSGSQASESADEDDLSSSADTQGTPETGTLGQSSSIATNRRDDETGESDPLRLRSVNDRLT